MRLLAGAGPRGLAGIAPAHGPIVRPLLETRRVEIVDHLKSRGLDWREDATNRDPSFLRNRLRHDVLPHLSRALGADVAAALCRSASLCRRLVTDLERHAEAELGRVATQGPGGLRVPRGRAPGESRTSWRPRCCSPPPRRSATSRPRRAAIHRAVRRLLRAETPRRAVNARPALRGAEREVASRRAGPPPHIGSRARCASPARSSSPASGCASPRAASTGPSTTRRRVSRGAWRSTPISCPVRWRRRDGAPEIGSRRSGPSERTAAQDVPHRCRRPALGALARADPRGGRGEIIWVAGVRRASCAPDQ